MIDKPPMPEMDEPTAPDDLTDPYGVRTPMCDPVHHHPDQPFAVSLAESTRHAAHVRPDPADGRRVWLVWS